MSTAEYHAAARGESWKFRLMGDIDECMRYAESKDEFITLMRSEGYNVRWQDSRKSITYTLPGGMKCRDDRLHDERYLKEAMEREFRIRERIVHGGIKAVESPAGFADVTQPEPHPTQGEWVELLQTLASLNRRVAAQADLLRELSQRPRTYPTQEQIAALARDVTAIRETLPQAGKRRERHILLPRLRLPHLSPAWLLIPVILLVLLAVWYSWGTLWNGLQTLLP
ncbi:MAG TPA: hypothetical protein VN622_00020 [Clostridia bacterium]|nr:hypothetical protein [Clostridia bacterium]